MPLIYVTGIETAGKTTACNELKKRGYEAYDIDKGIAHYYNKETGLQSEWIESADKRTEEWHQQNDYIMDRNHIKQFADQAKDKHVFLCGTTQNDNVVIDLFDKVIYLYLDEHTLRQRMNKRHSGEFAFAPHEQEAVLSWHKSSEKGYRERGAVMIDATLPVKQVTDEILADTR
ncbi:MAG TPA: AAA family ATPase [Candidatus Saccharimonadales bacterium]|jgi:dephospho-CoA kinase